jgi:HlyD family secretion protein
MSKSGSSRGLLLIVLLVLAGAAVGGYFYWKEQKQRPPEFTTITVGKGDVVQAVTATGDLQPVVTVEVSSQISGLIREISVDYNSLVKEGQVLAQIDPATYEQRLKQAKADYASSEANATLVRINTDRVRELRTKNLVSQQELDQAEALLAQANAQLLTREAAVDDAKVNLARCTIRAPIDGIVISRQAEVGKTVAASLNAPTLFTIANDLTKMQINAAVAEADIGNVELDQVANFTVDAFQGRQFRGRVSQIRNSPVTNQNVVTYATIIDVRNEDQKLKPGMTANVSIVVAQRPNAIRIPNAALRVRMPEQASSFLVEAKPVGATDAQPAPAAKPLSEEEQRKARREILREVGFSPGSGPPSPEQLQRMQQLGKERGVEFDMSRWANRGGGQRNSSPGTPAAPVTRTVYRVVSADPKKPRIEAVPIKLGISDGIMTEVLSGLNEGDVLLTSFTLPGTSGGNAASNPFGGRSPFGGPGGPRR